MQQRFWFLLIAVVLLGSAVYAQDGQSQKWKFSGLAFGDYFYNVTRDTSFNSKNAANAASTGMKNLNGFQFRRIYLTFDDDISDKFAFRFRTEDDQAEVFANGKIGSFVKDAYLKWKGFFSGSDLTFGMQPTPAFDISEGLWGYRSLEKTIMDLHSVVGSRDFGLSLRGKIDDEGTFGYWVMVANGASTGTPETDKYKRYYINLMVKPVTNLTVTVYGDYAAAAPGANGIDNDKSTLAAFVDYGEKDNYNFGVELFSQDAANLYKVGANTASLVAQGLTVYGSYNFTQEWAGVVRYDIFDPNINSNAKGDSRNLLIAGLSYKADKNVWIQPNIEYETYESIPNGPTPDASLTGRLTFYFIFN